MANGPILATSPAWPNCSCKRPGGQPENVEGKSAGGGSSDKSQFFEAFQEHSELSGQVLGAGLCQKLLNAARGVRAVRLPRAVRLVVGKAAKERPSDVVQKMGFPRTALINGVAIRPVEPQQGVALCLLQRTP